MSLLNPTPRRATAADAAALNALARAAYAIYVPVIGRAPLPMASDWAALIAEQEVWMIDGRPGEAMASLALRLAADHLVVWSVAVAPDRQHGGVGRLLMEFAEQRARGLGIGELRLFTNIKMSRNIALYRRLGYVETGHETRERRHIVHMVKRLDGGK